uniref:PPM-type phosphatase domain-containing protein n=1 Tax=viral metagenome TaxID=1070528 RepID=A0A6C0JYV7_9ZZZZ
MRTGVWTIDGRGRPSEDRYFIQDLSGDFLIAGVFDGHSGSSTVDLTIKLLPSKLAELIKTVGDNEQALRAGLQRTFIEHDKTIAKQGPLFYRNSGSTATVAIITPTHCYIAFIGDSPAFIFDPDTAAVISAIGKHSPARSDEHSRIVKNDGFITMEEGDAPRVDGALMVSRAFGDFSLKFQNERVPEFDKNWAKDFRVVADPEIIVIPRPARGYLAICSDGLVDKPDGEFRTPNEIANEIVGLGLSDDLNSLAKQLIYNQVKVYADSPAEYSASDADDITLVLVDFSKSLRGGAAITRKARRKRKANTKKTSTSATLPKTFLI